MKNKRGADQALQSATPPERWRTSLNSSDAPIKTGKELGMKESYDEGLANHIGPESCANHGNIISEALTGESAGWVLSPERDLNPSADVLQLCRRQHLIDRCGEGCEGSAGSETPGMHRNSLGGNRETLCLASGDCAEVRMENPRGVRP